MAESLLFVKYLRVGAASLLAIILMALAGVTVSNSARSQQGVRTQLSAPVRASTPVATLVPTVATQPVQAVVTPQSPGGNSSTTPQSTAEILDARPAVKAAGAAVVTIRNASTTRNGQGRQGSTLTTGGSGVILNRQGYIVTNYHVIQKQSSLQVIFSDGTATSAKVVGSRPASDLAVIKVEGAVPAVAQFGNSDALEAGEPVIAIGSATSDFRNSVTVGVVSALHRDLVRSGATTLKDMIQTDAAINEGNSGGPLLTADGRVVGINTIAVRDDGSGIGSNVVEGLGFAIPGNTALDIAQQLIKVGATP